MRRAAKPNSPMGGDLWGTFFGCGQVCRRLDILIKKVPHTVLARVIQWGVYDTWVTTRVSGTLKLDLVSFVYNPI